MTLGYIGLGKMGKNMVLRLLEQKVDVVVWNRSIEPITEVVAQGARSGVQLENSEDLKHFISLLPSPRIIWLMLPAGSVTDEYIDKLLPDLNNGDLLIDGANSFYKDTLRRNEKLASAHIQYIDVAVSGGPGGARSGACLMVGGSKDQIEKITPLLKVIAAPDAWIHCGPIGSGHFAKMVHNGIEYGMMQAIAEGAAILQKSPFNFNLANIFSLYNRRSVIESRLVGWTQEALAENPTLEGVSSIISHSGEGEWTVQTAKELDVPVPIIEASLNVRKRSAEEPENFRNKVVTAQRGKFGGHDTMPKNV